jgi:hypothetical protein
LVSTPQWDTGANNFGSALKSLGNNCDSAILVLLSNAINRRQPIALGHSMIFRLSEFHKLNEDNWKILNSFLAEDLAYAHLFHQAGKKTVLRNIYCPVIFSDKTVKQVFSQKVRWLLNQKMVVGNRFLYLLGALHYPCVPAFFYLIASGFSAGGWALFAFAAVVRTVIAAVVEAGYLHTLRVSAQYFWTVPLWDLSQIYFCIHGFFKTKISYGAKTYRVVNRFFLQEVAS